MPKIIAHSEIQWAPAKSVTPLNRLVMEENLNDHIDSQEQPRYPSLLQQRLIMKTYTTDSGKTHLDIDNSTLSNSKKRRTGRTLVSQYERGPLSKEEFKNVITESLPKIETINDHGEDEQKLMRKIVNDLKNLTDNN